MTVIIFDKTGHFDTFTLTQVQDDAAHLQHRGQELNYTIVAGATITQIVSNTYYRNAATNQLMRYDGVTRRPARRQRRRSPLRVFRRSARRPPSPIRRAGANCLYDAMHNYIGLADADRRRGLARGSDRPTS